MDRNRTVPDMRIQGCNTIHTGITTAHCILDLVNIVQCDGLLPDSKMAAILFRPTLWNVAIVQAEPHYYSTIWTWIFIITTLVKNNVSISNKKLLTGAANKAWMQMFYCNLTPVFALFQVFEIFVKPKYLVRPVDRVRWWWHRLPVTVGCVLGDVCARIWVT